MRSTRAFSLVELIVVTSIIGVLATIGLVSFSKVREKQKITKAKSDISQIVSAVTMFHTETKMFPSGKNVLSITGNGNLIDQGSLGLMACDSNVFDSPGFCTGSWKGPYYKGNVKDPWGTAYRIDSSYVAANSNRQMVAVVSYGKDALGAYSPTVLIDEGSTGVTSPDGPGAPATPTTQKRACDDIFYNLYTDDVTLLAGRFIPICPNFKGQIN